MAKMGLEKTNTVPPLFQVTCLGGPLLPTPLRFTDRAAAVLKESLHNQEREPEQVIRLLIDPEGNIRLALDIPRDGDQRVDYQGDTIVVIEPAICIVLAEVTVDAHASPNGITFSVQRDPDPN